MSEFSVIIPTLQRSEELRPLVEQCAAHPRVLEVLVINNAPTPLTWTSPKVRVLQQEENIFVNPAWNLGAREARGRFLAIVNDDVRFEDEVFDHAAKVLGRGLFGIIGPARSCAGDGGTRSIGHRPAPDLNPLYGVFMAMRRADYTPIPEDMPIWGGDDWLFFSAHMPPAAFVHTSFITEMSVTSGSAEFTGIRAANMDASIRHLGALHLHGEGRGTVPSRWWHVFRRGYGGLLAARARLRRA